MKMAYPAVHRPRAIVCMVLLAVFLGFSANAAMAEASKESREREALRRSQQAAAKLQQEKADLEREKGEAAAKLATTTTELDKLKKGSAASEKRAASLQHAAGAAARENEELRGKLAAAEKTIADLTTGKKGLEQAAQEQQKRWEGEQQSLQAKLGKEEENGHICTKKNRQLAAVAIELTDRYQKKGVWSALAGSEPLTGLKSVEMENLLQDYRERVGDNTLGANDKQ